MTSILDLPLEILQEIAGHCKTYDVLRNLICNIPSLKRYLNDQMVILAIHQTTSKGLLEEQERHFEMAESREEIYQPSLSNLVDPPSRECINQRITTNVHNLYFGESSDLYHTVTTRFVSLHPTYLNHKYLIIHEYHPLNTIETASKSLNPYNFIPTNSTIFNPAVPLHIQIFNKSIDYLLFPGLKPEIVGYLKPSDRDYKLHTIPPPVISEGFYQSLIPWPEKESIRYDSTNKELYYTVMNSDYIDLNPITDTMIQRQFEGNADSPVDRLSSFEEENDFSIRRKGLKPSLEVIFQNKFTKDIKTKTSDYQYDSLKLLNYQYHQIINDPKPDSRKWFKTFDDLIKYIMCDFSDLMKPKVSKYYLLKTLDYINGGLYNEVNHGPCESTSLATVRSSRLRKDPHLIRSLVNQAFVYDMLQRFKNESDNIGVWSKYEVNRSTLFCEYEEIYRSELLAEVYHLISRISSFQNEIKLLRFNIQFNEYWHQEYVNPQRELIIQDIIERLSSMKLPLTRWPGSRRKYIDTKAVFYDSSDQYFPELKAIDKDVLEVVYREKVNRMEYF